MSPGSASARTSIGWCPEPQCPPCRAVGAAVPPAHPTVVAAVRMGVLPRCSVYYSRRHLFWTRMCSRAPRCCRGSRFFLTLFPNNYTPPPARPKHFGFAHREKNQARGTDECKLTFTITLRRGSGPEAWGENGTEPEKDSWRSDPATASPAAQGRGAAGVSPGARRQAASSPCILHTRAAR